MKLKSLLVLSLILAISSCGHNKIRKVRVNNNKALSYSNLKKGSRNLEKKTIIAAEEVIVENNEFEKAEITANEEIISSDDYHLDYSHSENLQPQDSTDVKPTASQEEFDESRESEQNARDAKLFFLLFFPGLIFGPLGLLFYIIGNRKYKKAKRARFTTPKGEELERKAKISKIVVSSIFLGLMLVGAIALLFSEPGVSLVIGVSALILIGIVALFSNIFL